MTIRKLTVGTKVRINSEADDNAYTGKIGKVIEVYRDPDTYPYLVKFKMNGAVIDCPFYRFELTRINKRKS